MTQPAAVKGYYYLHTNGDLIYKSEHFDPADFDSDFVVKWWRFDNTDRMDAWTIILEAIALKGVTPRVKELSAKWKMDFKDSCTFCARAKPTPVLKKGLVGFVTDILGMTEEEYFKKMVDTKGGTIG